MNITFIGYNIWLAFFCYYLELNKAECSWLCFGKNKKGIPTAITEQFQEVKNEFRNYCLDHPGNAECKPLVVSGIDRWPVIYELNVNAEYLTGQSRKTNKEAARDAIVSIVVRLFNELAISGDYPKIQNKFKRLIKKNLSDLATNQHADSENILFFQNLKPDPDESCAIFFRTIKYCGENGVTLLQQPMQDRNREAALNILQNWKDDVLRFARESVPNHHDLLERMIARGLLKINFFKLAARKEATEDPSILKNLPTDQLARRNALYRSFIRSYARKICAQVKSTYNHSKADGEFIQEMETFIATGTN